MNTLPILQNHDARKSIGVFGRDSRGWYVEFPKESKIKPEYMIDSAFDVAEMENGYITKAYIYYLNITK